jgi:SPW repeat
MVGAMTAFRLISLPAHGALELLLGLALMASPFVLGFGTAGTLAAVVVGALVVGLALSAAVSDTEGVDIAAHYAYDVGLALGLLGAGVALAVSGDGPAAFVFVAGAIAQLALNSTTRYTAR